MSTAARSREEIGRDNSEALRLVREVSVDVGPRLAGSAEEAAAASWLAANLEKAGFETTVEPFATPSSFALAYGLLAILSLVAFGVAFVLPLAAAVIGLVAVGLLFAENLTIECASRLVPRVTSRNVIGRRTAQGEAKRTVVVTAHIDSARAGIVFHPRMVKAFRVLFVLMVAGMVLIPIVSILQEFGATTTMLYAAAPFAAHLLVCLGILAHQHFLAPVVPGASDNASGVAALVLVARALPHLEATDVWIVGTGAEEAGLVGMLRLLQKHRFDRPTTYFLNIDSVASPKLRFNSSEGMLITRAADAHLLEVAGDAAEKADIEVTVAPARVISSDAVVALMRSYRVMTISAESTAHWHWPTDVVDNVAPDGPANAAYVATETIRTLDREAAGGQRAPVEQGAANRA